MDVCLLCVLCVVRPADPLSERDRVFACNMYRGADKSLARPCLMVRIFLLMLVLLYVQYVYIYIVLIYLELCL